MLVQLFARQQSPRERRGESVLLHGHGRTSVGAARWRRERWIWELFKRTSSPFDAGSAPIRLRTFANAEMVGNVIMVGHVIKDGRLFDPEQSVTARM
jgi:hypothetical protein